MKTTKDPTLIVVTGTPGTGKTTLSKDLAKGLNYAYADMHSRLIKKKLYDSYDRSRKCYVIRPPVFRKEVAGILAATKKEGKKEGLIVDSLMSHEVKTVELCIVANCDLKVLMSRLKKRKYSAKKIAENLEAEVFDVCKIGALEGGHKVLAVDTTKKLGKKKFLEAVKKALRSKKPYHEFP